MDTYEAYAHLGLTPLDDYLRVSEPGHGSTTWMLVEAVLHSIHHGGYPSGDVIICAHTIAEAKNLWWMCQILAERFGVIVQDTYKQGEQGCKMSTGSSLYYGSYNTVNRTTGDCIPLGRKFPEAKQFWDAKWKDMAIRRKQGPYARIRKLTYNTMTNGFDARDERDEFILAMTPEGADRHMCDNATYPIELVDPKNLLKWS